MSTQLPLDICLRSGATFANFIAGPNSEALNYLRHTIRETGPQSVYLWGADSTGKSHLLQGACHEAAKMGWMTAYIPLAQTDGICPAMLDGMENMALVCVDDIDMIAGVNDWETALFHLYNRIRENNAYMFVAANASPGAIPIDMPDLRSRLSWGMVYQLFQLSDEIKVNILQQRASERGMEMPGEVACYLLRHFPRDIRALLAVLDQLDYESQVAQRKLTIPFVRKFMKF